MYLHQQAVLIMLIRSIIIMILMGLKDIINHNIQIIMDTIIMDIRMDIVIIIMEDIILHNYMKKENGSNKI